MLETPLGLLYVYKNYELMKYYSNTLPLKPIEICPYEVDERYLIEIDKGKISKGDIVIICIDTNMKSKIDGGDCLVEAMFESDDVFLAIGGYDINDHDNTNNFAYNISVIDNGLKIEFVDLSYVDELLLAIAWSTKEREDSYISVWFCADPCI